MGVRFRLSNRRFKKDFNQKCPLNWHAPTLLSSSLMTVSTSLETRLLPSSRPPTSKLSPSGPDSSRCPQELQRLRVDLQHQLRCWCWTRRCWWCCRGGQGRGEEARVFIRVRRRHGFRYVRL